MSRTTLAIKMLNILGSNQVVSRKELAQRLEVKLRYVSLLREELIMAGYDIETVYGQNGGYRLNKANIVPTLDQDIYNNLCYLLDYIAQRDIFLNKTQLLECLEKMLSSASVDHKQQSFYRHETTHKYTSKTVARFNENLMLLNKSMIKQKQVKISYYNEQLEFKTDVFQACQVIEYKGEWFVQGLLKKDLHWYNKELPLTAIYAVEQLAQDKVKLEIEQTKIPTTRLFVVVDLSNKSDAIDISRIGFHYEYVSNQEHIVKFFVSDIFSFHNLLKKLGDDVKIISHNLF